MFGGLLGAAACRRLGEFHDIRRRRNRPGCNRTGTDVGQRQVKNEGAADAGRAPQLDLAAEQVCQFAADRQSEAGAAVFAARRGIRLLERLEDDALFFRRNTDAGIDDLKGDHRRRVPKRRVIRRPAACCRCNAQCHAALRRELEGVRQQVLEDLLEPLGVGNDALRNVCADLDRKRQVPCFRFVPERPRHHFEQVADEDLLGIDRDRSGLDFGEIEDVADEVEQIGAGAWMVLANSTCLPDRLPSGFSPSC